MFATLHSKSLRLFLSLFFFPSFNLHFLLYTHPDPEEVATRILKRNRCGIPKPSRKGIVPTSVRRATVRTDLSTSLNCYPSRRGERLLLPSMSGKERDIPSGRARSAIPADLSMSANLKLLPLSSYLPPTSPGGRLNGIQDGPRITRYYP